MLDLNSILGFNLQSCQASCSVLDDISFSALILALEEAMEMCPTRTPKNMWESHYVLKRMYNWRNVAKRSVKVR